MKLGVGWGELIVTNRSKNKKRLKMNSASAERAI